MCRLRNLAWIVAFVLVCAPASAQPAFDDGGSNTTASDTTLSVSDLTVSGSNRFLVAALCFDDNTTNHNPSATWNSVSMTRQINNTVKRGLAVFTLVAPDTGNNTLTFSWTTATRASGVAASYTSVDQATPDDGWVAATATNLTATINTTSASGDLVVDAVCFNGGTTLTVGAGQTQRHALDNGAQIQAGISEEAGAGTVTSSWTAGFEDNAIAAANLNVSSGGGGGSTGTSMMTTGVGR